MTQLYYFLAEENRWYFAATDHGLLILLDYTKAFDIIWAIMRFSGFFAAAAAMIDSYLYGRIQQVELNGRISEAVTVSLHSYSYYTLHTLFYRVLQILQYSFLCWWYPIVLQFAFETIEEGIRRVNEDLKDF